MKATRPWGKCRCGCEKEIEPGMEFHIIEGEMFIQNHQKKPPLTRPKPIK